MKVKLEDSFDGAFGIPYDESFTVDDVMTALVTIPNKMAEDTSKLMGVVPEAVEKGNFERMYISVPGKMNVSFGVPVRSYYTNDSLAELLQEFLEILKVPEMEDNTIF